MKRKPIVFSDVHRYMEQLERVKKYLLEHTNDLENEIDEAYNTLTFNLWGCISGGSSKMRVDRVRRIDIPDVSYRCRRGECLFIDKKGVLWVLRG